jgi:hypothetical protein
LIERGLAPPRYPYSAVSGNSIPIERSAFPFAIRRGAASAPASDTMAVTRLSVNAAWNTVVTLLLSKRAESDFSAAPPRVSLSGEQPLCEEIFTNDDVLGRKASLIVQSRQQVQLRRQNTQPVDRKQRYSVVQPVMAVTSQFMIATSQKTLM